MFNQKGFSPIVTVILIAVLGAVGFGIYFYSHNSSPNSQISSQPAANVTQTMSQSVPEGEFKTTMTDLIARGTSSECDWKMPGEVPEGQFSNGKLWMHKGMGRSFVSGEVQGISVEASAIYKDKMIYTWSDLGGTKQGVKLEQATAEEMNNSLTSEERQQAEQIRQEMAFNCKPWMPDVSKFEVPSDITWQEL